MTQPVVGIACAVVGLACAACGLYGVMDSVRFSGAEHADAIVVGVDPADAEGDVGLLEFVASGHRHRVAARGAWGLRWAGTTGTGTKYSVVYLPERPDEARLAGVERLYGIPLMLLGLGCIFSLAGVLVLRHRR